MSQVPSALSRNMVQGMEAEGEERGTFSLCNGTLVPAAAEETLPRGSLSSKRHCSTLPPAAPPLQECFLLLAAGSQLSLYNSALTAAPLASIFWTL